VDDRVFSRVQEGIQAQTAVFDTECYAETVLEGQAGRADGSMVATDRRVDQGVVLLYLPQGPIRRGIRERRRV
jgi:hypothetical protein